MGALIATARAGMGAALVADVLVEKDIASNALVCLLPGYGYESGGILALYPSKRNPTAAFEVFLDFIIASSETKYL